jgi:hypothetical protein
MNVEQSNEAEQVLLEERARRPHWRSALRKATPSWFSGHELDLLDPAERESLYREISSRTQSSRSTLFIVAAINLPNIVRGFQSDGARRLLWTSVAIGYALIFVGAWLYRRKRVLTAARSEVRERADWPLRLLNRA